MEWINLPAYQQKSFYGKAKVAFDTDNNCYLLKSCNIVACAVRPFHATHGFALTRIWDGYSATTLRHVNGLLRCLGYWTILSRAEWESIPAHPQDELNLHLPHKEETALGAKARQENRRRQAVNHTKGGRIT